MKVTNQPTTVGDYLHELNFFTTFFENFSGGRVDRAVRNIVVGDVHVFPIVFGANDQKTQAGWRLCRAHQRRGMFFNGTDHVR